MEGSHANLRLQGDLPDERLKYGIIYIRFYPNFIPHGDQWFGGRLKLESTTKTAINIYPQFLSTSWSILERRQ